MSTFELYLKLGSQHISDLGAYDHILFVIALLASYTWREWGKIIGLVTAFTFGHSLTLVLSVLKMVNISNTLIETLIPITIIVTCILNLFAPEHNHTNSDYTQFGLKYILVLGFGLIHGLGFSNYLRELLDGSEEIVLPLFAFNIGLELGQICIAAIILLIMLIVLKMGVSMQKWRIALSVAVLLLAVRLLILMYI